MRELKFVEVTEDGAHMLLRTVDPAAAEPADGTPAADASTPTPSAPRASTPALQRPARPAEEFLLPIDERLRIASRGDRSGLGQLEIELEATLRPREIQARIRTGESAEAVAAAAGVPLQRVLRFAYPVLQERQQVTIEARRTRIRRGESAPRLGEQVDERLRRHGVNVEASRWDAYRRDDGIWALTLRWTDGTEERQARWSFDLPARSLVPADDAAAELQAEEPRRRLLAPAALIDEPPRYPTASTPARPHSAAAPPNPPVAPQAATTTAAGPAAVAPPTTTPETVTPETATSGSAAPPAAEPDRRRARRRTGRRRTAAHETNAETPQADRETTASPEDVPPEAVPPEVLPTEAVPTEAVPPEAVPPTAARTGGPAGGPDRGETVNELDRQANQPTAPIAPLHAEEPPTEAASEPTANRRPTREATPEATREAAQDALLEAPESTSPEPAGPARSGSTKPRKSRVPAWDDIMFGTRPNRD